MQCFDFEISGKILRTWQVGFFFKWVTVGFVLCSVLCCIFLNAISLSFIENVNRREINAGLICGLIFESSIQSVLTDETAVPHF